MEIETKTTYTIKDMDFEDVELICQGLDELQKMHIDDALRVQEIIKLLENGLVGGKIEREVE